MKGKSLVLIFSFLSFVSTSVFAQLGLPTIKSSSADGKNIELRDLKVNVEVVGNVATTTFDMTFYNPTTRTLEGEFNFPLAEGQTVSRYALDIDGKLREGVVVEKEKGRVTFEKKVREGVDPGLLEMTAGNNFRTRIYPFSSKGTRRVVVACEQELTSSNGKRFYSLPMQTDSKIANFTLETNVRNELNKPVVSKGSIDDIYFNPKDQGFVSQLVRKNITLKKGLFLEFPQSDFPKIYTENAGLDTYFYIYSPIKPKTVLEKEKPSGVTVVYDVSSSSQDRNLDRDFDFLESYAQAQGISNVRLVTFSYRQHLDTTCKVKDVRKIIRTDTPIFDGATQLGSVDLSKFGTDEILFFSDGMGNIGKDTLSLAKGSVITVNSNPMADHNFLRLVALKNGGTYINLCSLNNVEAVNLLTHQEYQFIKAKYDADKISEVYPSMPTRVIESFSISGIMKSKEADITLYYGFGNRVTDSVTCHVSAINPVRANNVKRIWAQKKLAELDFDSEKNKREIIELSKQYGIVTRNTSLIVLETVNDYVRYEITPPEELMDQYLRMMASKPKPASNDTSYRTGILAVRKDFLQWWNTKYDPNAKPSNDTVTEVRSTVRIRGVGSLAAQSEEPVILADEMQVDEDPGELAEVVVTTDYGHRRESRRDMTGSVSQVEAEALHGAPSASVENALAGRVSGIRVSSAESSSRRTSQQRNGDGSSASSVDGGGNASVQVQYWNPDVPYLSELKSVRSEQMYDAYLKMKPKYAQSPSFYLDVAEYFHREKQTDAAIRVLSNLAELKLEDAEVARSCANKLVEFKSYELAASVYERVAKMRGEEPQSYRDLALVYIELGQLQKAADLLYKVGFSKWDSRFRNIQQIAINELNSLIELNPGKIDTSAYDKRLLGNCPVDIRIILTWNTNDCDIDLWVTDPNGEKCFYKHPYTVIGGRLSDDITQGYGPEEFCLKNAAKGDYLIEANYYGTRSQKQLQPVVVQATIYTNFGRPNQKKQVLTLQLGNAKDVYKVGTIKF
jgi:tetratricopeptide (TPR) repeat protein